MGLYGNLAEILISVFVFRFLGCVEAARKAKRYQFACEMLFIRNTVGKKI